MRGIVRPCRSSLGPELSLRWQAHLCGLCLTLRDAVGQPERVLTGYDVLLLSVLVEAQAGQVETTSASPCPLRGFTRATVVSSRSDAGRLAAAAALVGAAAGLTDKIADDDLPRAVRGPARSVAARLDRSGRALAASVGLDPTAVLTAPAASAEAERTADPSLAPLLAPTGEAVASLFAHTAAVAGRPENGPALAAAGRAFGALVHLLDAVADRDADRAAERFNPLTATGTGDEQAAALAERLVADVRAALARAELADRALVDVLLGRELLRAVHRALPSACPRSCSGEAAPAVAVPTQRGAATAALALWGLVAPAVFIGGWSSGGGWGPRRRRRRYGPPPMYGYPPYEGYGRRYGRGYGPGYGMRRGGPSCGELLACNCCANLACNACCCGNECANG